MSSGAKGGRKSRAEKASFLSAHSAVTMGLAVFLLAIGAGLGFTGAYVSGLAEGGSSEEVVQLPPANWPEDIAEFHAFLTKESVQVSAESQSNPEMVRFQLGQLFNGVSLPDFSGQGLQFVRGQILSYRGNKIMQLVYLNRKEPLIALYIGAGGLDMPIIPGRFGDIKTVSWSENELRFVLAADMPQQALQALAVIAKSQLSKK